MSHPDVFAMPLPRVDLQLHERACDALVEGLLRKGATIEGWYAAQKNRKKRAALWVRGLGMVLAGLAPTVTMLATLVPARWEPLVDLKKVAAGATLLLSVAAATVVLDKFYGWSSGWMRYVRTMFEVQRAVEELQLGWLRIRTQLAPGVAPTAAQLDATFDLALAFVRRVDDAMRAETDAWIAEFGRSLGELEPEAKVRDRLRLAAE